MPAYYPVYYSFPPSERNQEQFLRVRPRMNIHPRLREMPFITSILTSAAYVSPTLLGSISIFGVASGMILTNPQRIPGWCALGAAVAVIFSIYHARKKDQDPFFLAIVAMITLLAGVAGPRVVLQHAFRIEEAIYSGWYPESFVFLGTLCAMSGWTVWTTIHKLITSQLPGVVTRFADRWTSATTRTTTIITTETSVPKKPESNPPTVDSNPP